MEILNLIEVLGGDISQILSYVVHEEQLKDEVVSTAENDFKKILMEVKGFEEEDCESIIEDGYYNDDNGWEVYLTWSSEVM